MEHKTRPESAVDPPRFKNYEETLRARRAAEKAKLAAAAKPVVEHKASEDAVEVEATQPKSSKKFKLEMPKLPKLKKPSSIKIFKKDKEAAPKPAKKSRVKGTFTKLDKCLDSICKSILCGIITAVLLNVVTKFFWPELPTKIPTIYAFFDGFLTVGEFLYKTALGGIASIFKGNFLEFCYETWAETKELWNAFCTWMSSIHF